MRTIILYFIAVWLQSSMASASTPLYLCFGPDIHPRVRALITKHILAVDPTAQNCGRRSTDDAIQNVLLFGPRSEEKLTTDIAVDRVQYLGTTYYIARGRSSPEHPFINAHFAAYALLEQVGFRFLHPLKPEVPSSLRFPAAIAIHESARWPVRRWHIHTQHPLELTNLLNGWGTDGPEDQAGFDALLPEWESFLEWSLANKQNEVSWYLLMAKPWQDFADGPLRQSRLKTLNQIAHEFDIDSGVTAPLAFKQQHAWTMIREDGNEVDQIHRAIDWLAGTGLEFIEIEMGFSEFTHPDDRTMLSWMNEATAYARDRHHIRTAVKVHSSTGQEADHFKNPVTGAKLNFNFLPYYADPGLAVMPHTVQIYGLKDPAPTYGNQDFSAITEYMRWEAGRRPVYFYPETAYWVSYDIDVPLFLPVYGERRLSDLRLLAKAEDDGSLGLGTHEGSKIQGQVNFSSGWEWGYWLGDVMAARAAWDPGSSHQADTDALKSSLAPVTSLFGAAGPEFERLMLDLIQFENAALIHGQYAGQTPSTPLKRSGQAYLQGVDSWDDMGDLFNFAETQPDKLGLLTVRSPLVSVTSPSYDHEIAPLLSSMNDAFAAFSARMNDLEPRVPDPARSVFLEFKDALELTSLRAKQVYALYQYARTVNALKAPSGQGDAWRLQADRALQQGLAVVAQRVNAYRVPPSRIAAWKTGPTAYNYGYLWTVSNLFYWRRDAGKAVDGMRSPCFMNIVDPIDVAFGYDLSALSSWTECLSKPAAEPQFP